MSRVFNLGSINIDHVYRIPHLPRGGRSWFSCLSSRSCYAVRAELAHEHRAPARLLMDLHKVIRRSHTTRRAKSWTGIR
jgi:hypothetical protein